MRRSGLMCVLGCGFVYAVMGLAQAQVAPVAGSAAGQPGGRMSGGYAWPENLPAPVLLWAGGAPGALGERGGQADDYGVYSGGESDEDGGGG